jgi:hypothetical protein
MVHACTLDVQRMAKTGNPTDDAQAEPLLFFLSYFLSFLRYQRLHWESGQDRHSLQHFSMHHGLVSWSSFLMNGGK